MRHNFIKTMLIIGLAAVSVTAAYAVKARPTPITVKQPDGTTLTVRIHGDEFLHWYTVGGRLVSKGPDGYFYYAEFNADGTTTRTSSRVTSNGLSLSGAEDSRVTPPASAIAAAKLRRQAASITPAANGMSIGDHHFLVLLIEFSDVKFTVPNPQQAFTRLLNEEGYSENGAVGSSRDYYIENSGGKFTPTFDVYGPVAVSGTHDQGAGDYMYRADYILAEACGLLDDEINFADYDINNDGIIDNVFFFFAGNNSAEAADGSKDERAIWPHKGEVSRPTEKTFDGRTLRTYACTSEYGSNDGYYTKYMATIGTFTHEFAHVLGLHDLYDTNYETNGLAAGLGSISIMDEGSYNDDGRMPPYFNGYERYMLGWMDLTEWYTSGAKTLKPIHENEAYITNTSNDGEFFLYEFRDGTGFDEAIGATGIAIYHIDQSDNIVYGSYRAKDLWEGNGNMINCYADHQCFDLIESTYPERVADAAGNAYKLFPGMENKTSLNSTTSPNNKTWAKEDSGFSISDMAISGSTASLMLKARDSGDPIADFINVGINAIFKNKDEYSEGDTFPFMLSLSNYVPISTEWYFDGEKQDQGGVVLTSGIHTVEARLTYEDGTTEKIITKIEVK
ncbi:MAG TPA: M6 family metalloprotease domain-containing protein [Candidatus Coprenecus pullistercoris]|nr:M6 family metalloprotease domain-containing protein [Candidatus Coprenecus pullistercoris]